MNISEAERHIRQKLLSIYDGNEASGIASLAIEHITGLDRSQRLINNDHEITSSQSDLMAVVIKRLLEQEPIQYILNKAWFYGMELYVDKDVLVPRPETEELVEWIIRDVKESGKKVFEKKPADADETTELKILDVGTGSGCIALALKKQMPLAEVWGCDISDRALNVARRNGSELDIRVDFQSVDFLDDAQQNTSPKKTRLK
jgi:release factor glutamine methyltransferase